MHRSLLPVFLLGLLALPAVSAFAADNASPETQLRETLRQTLLQLRNAETDKANLQAAKTALEDEKKALNEQLALQNKHSKEDRQAAEDAANKLKARVAEQEKEIKQLAESVEKFRGASRQLDDALRAKETDRAKLETDNGRLQRLIADREARNVALFKLGNEILDRYEKFGLGDALSAREPFTGLSRVKLQTLVQDYQDKICAQRVTAATP